MLACVLSWSIWQHLWSLRETVGVYNSLQMFTDVYRHIYHCNIYIVTTRSSILTVFFGSLGGRYVELRYPSWSRPVPCTSSRCLTGRLLFVCVHNYWAVLCQPCKSWGFSSWKSFEDPKRGCPCSENLDLTMFKLVSWTPSVGSFTRWPHMTV